MYIIKKILNGYKPLACMDNKIILSKGSEIYSSDLDCENIELICSIPTTKFIFKLAIFRILARLFRLDFNSCLMLDSDSGLIVRKNEIWSINFLTKAVSLDFSIPLNRKNLNLTLIKNIPGVEDSIVFGEYFDNPKKIPVNIWRRSVNEPKKWSVCFTFSEHEINHIHNIVLNKDNSKLIVLTGDFDNSARICEISLDFQKMTILLQGEQKFRATWLYWHNNQYYYASDSQFENNYIYSLNHISYSFNTSSRSQINGSSIYSAKNNNNIYFSSAVEPGELKNNFLLNVFETKFGPGILSNKSIIYNVDANGQLHEVLSAVKDFLPMRLAQFGTFSFPSGNMPEGRFYAYGIALKNYDNKCLIFQR